MMPSLITNYQMTPSINNHDIEPWIMIMSCIIQVLQLKENSISSEGIDMHACTLSKFHNFF